MPLTPHDFVSKWKRVTTREKQTYPPPSWLDLAHKRLDVAVFAAYVWKSDLSDEETFPTAATADPWAEGTHSN